MKTRTSFKKGHTPLYLVTGEGHSRYRHGMASTKSRNIIYSKWSGMKRRCLNKNDKSYPRYGGTGVTISKSWLDFVNFYSDMSSSYFVGASLDRIDNDKGYSKENCRWVPLNQQSKNRRCVPLYEINGEKLNARDWDRKLGLKLGTVRARIKANNWSIEKALTAPRKKYVGTFKDSRGRYRVEIKSKGKRYFIGRFDTKKEALKARAGFFQELLATKK